MNIACKRCKKSYPATTENFHKQNGRSWEIKKVCKYCVAEMTKEKELRKKKESMIGDIDLNKLFI